LNENFVAGLEITVSGILITFFALGIFILVMMILTKLFPGKVESQVEEKVTEVVEEKPVAAAVKDEEDEDLPVVIAAAISHFRSKAQSSLGTSLMEGKSGWWASNRMNAQQGLGIRIKRSGK
jgi:sodium pump decarboxylase gamma subunit